MGNKKGYIPWNKGLTEASDKRILSYSKARKIFFSDEQKEQIKKLYNEGNSPDKIGKILKCSKHPIWDFLKSENLIKTISEWRRIAYNNIYEKLENVEYNYNGTILKVVSGLLNRNTNNLSTETKIELICIHCKSIHIRTFNGYKSSLKYNDNKVICNKCGHVLKWFKHDRIIRTSLQQKTIAEMINAELNYKISNMYTDMALVDDKIIVEYDGWRWHGDKSEQNKNRRRDEFLKNLGWKILRIKSGRKLPNKEEVLSKIAILKNNNIAYLEIILDDCGKGDTIHGEYNQSIYKEVDNPQKL